MAWKGVELLSKSENHRGLTRKMRIKTDGELLALFASVKTVAVVGVSATKTRASYGVFEFWCKQGVHAIPVNPKLAGQKILDREVVSCLADIGEPIDLVDVFRASEHLPALVDELLPADVGALWTQLEVRHPQAEERVLSAGIPLVVDRCPAIEVPRLRKLGYEVLFGC